MKITKGWDAKCGLISCFDKEIALYILRNKTEVTCNVTTLKIGHSIGRNTMGRRKLLPLLVLDFKKDMQPLSTMSLHSPSIRN